MLDERTLELTVGGTAVEVERKPLELLQFLLRHAGEVVTKEECYAAVWPGRVLTDQVLTTCIHKVRDALGDSGQAIIRTVHGFGYRLVARVSVEALREAPAPHFAFKAGDHPPLRPRWNLVERLGTGGRGEAWLVRHDKTGERRVCKVALDSSHLASLKHEITIYRLLNDTLRSQISKLRAKRGLLAECETEFTGLLGEAAAAFGTENEIYGVVENDYAVCLMRAGRYAEARRRLEHARPHLLAMGPATTISLLNTQRLRQTYAALGMHAEAAALPPDTQRTPGARQPR